MSPPLAQCSKGDTYSVYSNIDIVLYANFLSQLPIGQVTLRIYLPEKKMRLPDKNLNMHPTSSEPTNLPLDVVFEAILFLTQRCIKIVHNYNGFIRFDEIYVVISLFLNKYSFAHSLYDLEDDVAKLGK